MVEIPSGSAGADQRDPPRPSSRRRSGGDAGPTSRTRILIQTASSAARFQRARSSSQGCVGPLTSRLKFARSSLEPRRVFMIACRLPTRSTPGGDTARRSPPRDDRRDPRAGRCAERAPWACVGRRCAGAVGRGSRSSGSDRHSATCASAFAPDLQCGRRWPSGSPPVPYISNRRQPRVLLRTVSRSPSNTTFGGLKVPGEAPAFVGTDGDELSSSARD